MPLNFHLHIRECRSLLFCLDSFSLSSSRVEFNRSRLAILVSRRTSFDRVVTPATGTSFRGLAAEVACLLRLSIRVLTACVSRAPRGSSRPASNSPPCILSSSRDGTFDDFTDADTARIRRHGISPARKLISRSPSRFLPDDSTPPLRASEPPFSFPRAMGFGMRRAFRRQCDPLYCLRLAFPAHFGQVFIVCPRVPHR